MLDLLPEVFDFSTVIWLTIAISLVIAPAAAEMIFKCYDD